MFGIDVVTAAQQHAKIAYPQESCGIVVNETYIPCANTASAPEKDFQIAQREYAKHIINGSLQAVIHSHPNGPDHPSESDLRHQMAMRVPWGILSRNRPIFWFGDQVPMPPLMGRKFRFGVTDCYTLVRHWFKMKRGVDLINIPCEFGWWERGENLYEENLALTGFVEIDQADIEMGDCILMSIPSGAQVTNHACVYVGQGLILHHLIGRISTEEPVARWVRYITKVVRYHG